MFVKFAACCAVSRICRDYGFLLSLTGFEGVCPLESGSPLRRHGFSRCTNLVSCSSILQNPVLFRRRRSAAFFFGPVFYASPTLPPSPCGITFEGFYVETHVKRDCHREPFTTVFLFPNKRQTSSSGSCNYPDACTVTVSPTLTTALVETVEY